MDVSLKAIRGRLLEIARKQAPHAPRHIHRKMVAHALQQAKKSINGR